MTKPDAKKANVLNEEQYKRLLRIVSTTKYAKRDTLIIMFSFGLGLRAKEIAGLKTSDILNNDLKPHEAVNLTVTKGNRKRTVYLVNQKILDAIDEYVTWRVTWAAKRREIFSGNQPFFVSQKGNGFTNITMAMLFKNIYKQAGLNASSHSGRRTFATNMLHRGSDVKSLQTLMGHASMMQTLDYVENDPVRLMKLTAQALY